MSPEPEKSFAGEARPVAPIPDALTGLVARGEFAGRLGQLLADAAGQGRGVVAIAINLDDFRSVNTLYGAATGDQVLRVTAERLVAGIRSRHLDEEGASARGSDLVARLGGDEFAILCGLPAPPTPEPEALAARLLRAIEGPMAVDGNALRLTASGGIVVTTPAHRGADDVLRDLDLAMQRAKAIGPGTVVAWQPSLTEAAMRRSSLAVQLRRAFDNGEFVLHYQPVLRLSDNRLVGAEALLRWNHPSEGLVSCATFVPVLEATGLIGEVGSWVLREAVRQVETWNALYGRDIVEWVGVNLSPRQLHDPVRLLATLRAIDAGGFSLHRLKLDITAAAFERDPGMVDAVLGELRGLGLSIAIDDFGTPQMWPDRRPRHPVDTIKIDRELTARIGTPAGDMLLQALLAVARLYGAAIVAEGIETPAERDFLRQIGCGFGQGYLFAEPMDGALFGTYALTHAAGDEAGSGTRLAG